MNIKRLGDLEGENVRWEMRRFYHNKQRKGCVLISSAYNDKSDSIISNKKSSVDGNSFSPNC